MSQKRALNKITELIIHCADTPNGKWYTAEQIDDWHKQRGFKRNPALIGFNEPQLKHIGYHFVINTLGAVRIGRGLEETGAHTRGHNSVSIGVCLIGKDQYSAEQWLSLKQFVQAMQNRFPALAVKGHAQINPHKTCPGFDVKAWLKGGMKPLKKHLIQLTKEHHD